MSLGAAKLIRDAAADLPADEPVRSPCICVCTMDAASGLCQGCWRTLDEIARWSGMDDTEKRAVWRRLAERVGPGE
jgi:predicted Fe-S protein YdhL (DUF1289 family)